MVDPETFKRSKMPSFQIGRRKHVMMASGSSSFAVGEDAEGGNSEENGSRSGEKSDVAVRRWAPIGLIKRFRVYPFSLLHVKSYLVALGGVSGEADGGTISIYYGDTTVMESFDPVSCTWTDISRSWFSAGQRPFAVPCGDNRIAVFFSDAGNLTNMYGFSGVYLFQFNRDVRHVESKCCWLYPSSDEHTGDDDNADQRNLPKRFGNCSQGCLVPLGGSYLTPYSDA